MIQEIHCRFSSERKYQSRDMQQVDMHSSSAEESSSGLRQGVRNTQERFSESDLKRMCKYQVSVYMSWSTYRVQSLVVGGWDSSVRVDGVWWSAVFDITSDLSHAAQSACVWTEGNGME